MRPKIIIIFIIGFGFFLRVWGVGFGLPHKSILDEEANIYAAFYSGSHALKPLRYLYAPFVPYLLLSEYGIFFLIGKVAGMYGTPQNFFISYLVQPTSFFLLGRLTMVLFGTGLIYLLFRIGKDFFSTRVGLLAALFGATSFLLIKESKYIKEDTISTFFMLTGFYFTLHTYNSQKIRNYLLSGFFLAFALAAKYQTGLLLLVVFCAHILGRRQIGFKKLLIFAAVLFCTFSLLHPYFILEFQKTVKGIIADAALARVPYQGHLLGKPVWWWFVFDHIPQGIGIAFSLSALLGMVVAFFKARKNLLYFLLLVFPLIFIGSIDFWSQHHYDRYAVMVVPFLLLLASVFWENIHTWFKRVPFGYFLLILFALVIFFEPVMRSIKFNTLLTKPDTRQLAKQWIEENIPQNAQVLVESTLRPEYPSNLNVALNLSNKQLDQRILDAEIRGQEGLYLKMLKKALEKIPESRYEIRATPRVDMEYDIFTSHAQVVETIETATIQDADVIVLSSWAIKFPLTTRFLASLENEYGLVQTISPTYSFSEDPHFIKLDYPVLDSVKPWKNGLIFGPEIKIYRKK